MQNQIINCGYAKMTVKVAEEGEGEEWMVTTTNVFFGAS